MNATCLMLVSKLVRISCPYKGYRHHLQDYKSRGKACRAKGIFNHAYSLLRNIIERCFDILKSCFPIHRRMTAYSLQTQVSIIFATVTLHNYISSKELGGIDNLENKIVRR